VTRSGWLSLLVSMLAAVVVIGGWKVYVEVSDVSRFVLPPPEDVASKTLDLIGEARTWEAVRTTLTSIVLAFAIATVGGVAMGLALGSLPLLDRAARPYLVVLQVIPKVAIIPLLLLWLGFGIGSRVAIGAVFAFFPIFAATRGAVISAEPGHRDLAVSLRARRRQRLQLFTFPGALPSILTGMEVGIVLATVGAVVAEYLAGNDGLGWLAVVNLNQLQVDGLFAVIVLLTLLGLILYLLVAGLRRVLVPWHTSARELLA
jgi:NitT/TauT family transport system permease protein